jgi:hypothetical protein
LATHLRALAPHLAIGVLAGVAAAHIRLHLGIPGHKALLWMLPVLVIRLRYRHFAGATAGASVAAFTSLALGGNLAGSGVGLGLALVPAAGAILDWAVAWVERLRLSPARMIPLIASAAMAANLVCAVKRLAAPAVGRHVLLGIADPFASIISYALMGLLCGLLAGLLHLGWSKVKADSHPKCNTT